MIRKILAVLVLGFLTFSTNAQIVSIPIPGSPLSLNVVANPQPLQNLYNNPAATNVTMGDDENRNVPLGFTFPYFNQNFTNSWMYSNGAISFQGPGAPGGFCCSGQPLSTSLQSGYNYSILPLWTDLIANTAAGGHYVLGTNNSMTYGWYNVNEYGTINPSSFEVKIDSTGAVDMRYSGAFVSLNHAVTVGLVGNASAGEFYQYYNGPGINWGPTQLSFIADPCVSNPLSSPTCSGYQAAYTQQQCTINPLYSPVCPGYAQAYFTQQCSINPLYDSSCPGYALAYFTQQCSINPLYDSSCPGYEKAYQDKLFADACKANPQSSPSCSGYITPSATTTTTASSTQTVSVLEPTVEKVVTSAPAASTATNPTTPIAVATQPTNNTQLATQAPAQTSTAPATQETTQEAKKTDAQTASIEKKSTSTADAKKQVSEKAKEAAGEMKKATTMESQVAAQTSVIGLMGYMPGFGAYQNAKIIDVNESIMKRMYGRDTVDNRSAMRQLSIASDRKWTEMTDDQYKK